MRRIARRTIGALALAVIGVPLWAAPGAAQRVQAEYAVRALGMTVMEVHITYDTNERGYAMEFSSRLRNVATVMGEGRQTTRVTGTWAPGGVQPIRYDADGVWRGDPRRTVVDWNGSQPTIRALVPPNEGEREEVTPALQRGAIDSLSAVALLIRQVGREGRCEANGRIYDGRRLTEMTARTERWEVLPVSRSEWSGRALRCAFEGRLVAGFHKDNNGPDARRPTPGTAWLGEAVPGVPPLPVRIEVASRWIGTMTAHLVSARLAPTQANAR